MGCLEQPWYIYIMIKMYVYTNLHCTRLYVCVTCIYIYLYIDINQIYCRSMHVMCIYIYIYSGSWIGISPAAEGLIFLLSCVFCHVYMVSTWPTQTLQPHLPKVCRTLTRVTIVSTLHGDQYSAASLDFLLIEVMLVWTCLHSLDVLS